MSDQTRTVAVDPEHAARVVADFADAHGLPVPTTPGEAVELARACGYDCTPGTVAEFVRKGYVSDPGGVADAVWVYCFIAALEARRRWKPTPCVHDPKKSGTRLLIEQMRNAGVAEPLNDIDRYTVEDLLLQLTNCDNRAVREALYEAVKAKLQGFEE